jgi:hypothetical protein
VRLEDVSRSERARVARLRAAIVADVGVARARAQPDRAHAFDPELFAGVDDETFVNAVANAFAFPAEEKQALLEAETFPSATRGSRARSRSSGSSSTARAGGAHLH